MRLVRASVALILIFVGLGSRAQADVPNCSDGSISQISDSALRTVAASGRDACLIECERYYQENPKARPASTKRTCEGFWRRAVSQVKLENQIRLRAACASGVWTGVLSLPESLRAYSLMVGNVGEALATAHREGWEFAERCQKDIACRRETARLLVRFRERRTDGSYLVPDAQVDREIASMNYRTLLTQVGQNQASLRQVCTQELERINFKVGPREDGRWTSAQLLERYRTMAAFDPACVGALGLLPPEMSASGPANPGRDWLESLGIQWQCYEPERAQELFCMEVAAFVVDPMAVLPAGNLALKAVAKAGLRRITRTAATSEVAVNSRVARQRVDEGAEVGGARVTDLTRSEARQRYNAQHLHKQFTTEVQNEVWISAAQAIRPKAGRRFLDVENAVMKALNDRLRDKNFVTSLTNRQKEILLGKIQKLLDETPGVQMLPYSDFKAMRFAFDGRLPADFEKRLARAVRSANDEFVDELRALKLVREGDNPESWFRAGFGDTADRASAAARVSRDIPGENILRSYQHPEIRARMEMNLKKAEVSRSRLDSELGETGIMSGVSGNRVPSLKAFELIRKAKDAESLAVGLRTRFDAPDVTVEQAERLLLYTRQLDSFSPALHIAKREIVNLDEAVHGGFSVDFLGLGAANQNATAASLAGVRNLDHALEAARLGERGVTTEFQARLNAFKDKIGEIAKCSGDDCVGVALKPLSQDQKRDMLAQLAADPQTRGVRVAFVSPGVAKAADRSLISVHGESIEKALRSRLEKEMPSSRLTEMTFGIDMRANAAGRGNVDVLIGTASDVRQVSAPESQRIREALARAIEDVNRELAEEGLRATYRPQF